MTTRRPARRVEPMRRVIVLAAAAMLIAAAVSADAATPGFRYGVAAGEITATSAILWTRAPSTGAVRVRVSQRRSLADGRLWTARATLSHDLTVSIAVQGLRPGSRYYYDFAQGRVAKPAWHLRHRAGIDHERERSLRGLRRCGRDPGQGRKARLQHVSRCTQRWRTRRMPSTSISATRSTRTARSPARRSRGP